MYLRPKPIARRHFLKGLGGAAMSLPYLNAMASNKVTAPPKRMVCIGINYGLVPQLFFPSEVGSNYKLPPLLESLEPHRDKFTVFSGLDHGDHAYGGHGGVHTFLTGIQHNVLKSFHEGNISVDQKAASHVGLQTRYQSMQLTAGSVRSNQLSWTKSGVAIPSIADLRHIYSLLFQPFTKDEESLLLKSFNEQRSILDLVSHDAKALQRRVGREDLEKIDQYFTSVRDVEKRLTQSEAWLRKPKPKVSYEISDDANELDLVERIPLYYDLMTLALQNDSTRVMTFAISQLGPNLGGLPITQGYHHLTHHGKEPGLLKELAVIEKFHTAQYSRFIEKLDSVKESDGSSLLDNTMTLFGSGLGNASSHSNKNLPMILAGGGFKHGNHLSYQTKSKADPKTPACNLFTSMLQQFGMDIEKFNTATGSLTGLERLS